MSGTSVLDWLPRTLLGGGGLLLLAWLWMGRLTAPCAGSAWANGR